MLLLLLFLASLWAGAQNALAGGGSFITLPALMLTGMDARAANITSTIALFPAQIVTGFTGRAGASGLPGLTMRTLYAISLAGGAAGGAILLATPPSFSKVHRPARRRAMAAALRAGTTNGVWRARCGAMASTILRSLAASWTSARSPWAR